MCQRVNEHLQHPGILQACKRKVTNNILLNVKNLYGFSRPFPVGNSREKSGKNQSTKGFC